MRAIKGGRKPGRHPELLLIAHLLDALIFQLQGDKSAAMTISEKAWREYETERPVTSDGRERR